MPYHHCHYYVIGCICMGKNIKGSCGGLNAISGTDKCLVCNKDIDPNNPLINQT